MGKEVDAKALLSVLNEIDTAALAEGAPLFSRAWEIEKKAMWRKGLAILQFFPELEEKINKPGRQRNAVSTPHSFRSVGQMVGRDPTAISKWVKMVMSIGKEETDFKEWIKRAETPVIENYSIKLLAADIRDETQQHIDEPSILVVADMNLLSIEERARGGVETDEDVNWLIKRVRTLDGVRKRALRALLDEKPKRAIEILETGAKE